MNENCDKYEPSTRTKYTFDVAGRLATVSGSPAVNSVSTLFQANSTSPLSYGAPGLQYAQLGINSSGTAAFSLNRSYDKLFRRTSEADLAGATTAYNYSISSFAANGNLSQVADSVMGTWNYQYDTLNRLTSSTTSGGQYNNDIGCWVYDPFGNRTSESMSTTACTSNPTPLSWETYGTSNTNRADTTSIGGNTFDAAGNILYDGLYNYLYDGEGRICAAQNTVSHTMTGYLYDSGGNRAGKGTISTFSCNKSTNGFTPTAGFVSDYSGAQITETNGSTGWTHTNVSALGALLATYHDTGIYFAFNDWLGTKRAEISVNNSCGSASNSLPYGDYLAPQSLSGYGTQCSDATEHHYTGKERDTESGNDYFGARYYASSMGRWMSPDPAGIGFANAENPQSLNLYGYVQNNPLAFVDPDGLQTVPDANCGWVRCVLWPTIKKLFSGGGSSDDDDSGVVHAATSDPFQSLWHNYPTYKDHPTKPQPGHQTIWDYAGGKVGQNGNSGNFPNSCSIRMCLDLNASGFKLPYVPGSGVSSSDANHNWNYPRLTDLQPFLIKNFGQPKEYPANSWRGQLAGQTGILLFEYGGAGWTGHAELWNGSELRNPEEDYSSVSKGVLFWQVQ
jgi:RHS repeat-associated protein